MHSLEAALLMFLQCSAGLPSAHPAHPLLEGVCLAQTEERTGWPGWVLDAAAAGAVLHLRAPATPPSSPGPAPGSPAPAARGDEPDP